MNKSILPALFLAALVAFVAGRELRSLSSAPTAAASAAAVVRAGDLRVVAFAAPRGGSIAGLLRAIAVSVGAVRPASELERLAAATLHDSAEMRDLRHEIQLGAIRASGARIDPDVLEKMVAVNDAYVEECRALRAGFVLADMSEEEYVTALKDTTRASMQHMRGLLDREQFETAFHWRYDADAYDPEGGVAPPDTEPETEIGEPDDAKLASMSTPAGDEATE